jgi:xanthine dehydrogenase YagS FAD-binding subunit
MGGVAHKPWRIPEAEQELAGKPAGPENFARAADILLHGAHGYEHNRFKIELAKQGVVRALTVAAQGTSEVA